MLGAVHHLLNHCEACEAQLRAERGAQAVTEFTRQYARWCVDKHAGLHAAAKLLDISPLNVEIQTALLDVNAFVVGFELGVPSLPGKA